jgi:lipopolysaccharide/colanic/teichoic acid biosynthesis glycosyltransferase
VPTSPVERVQTTLDPNYAFVRGELSAATYPSPGRAFAPQVAPRRDSYEESWVERGSESTRNLKRLWLDRACRIVNFCAAFVALVLTLPLMVVIALAVRLGSPGPIFYVQNRVGMDRRQGSRTLIHCRRKEGDRGGKVFRIYKFRTMHVHAQPVQVWASKDDPRITRIGKFLRAYRLDELPQLLNVLKGDMNVVGPRPEQPQIFQELRRELRRYPERQRVLPGITGWAQINHHYDQSIKDVERKLHLDLEYIQRRSALEDLGIMIRTIPVMLFRRGAM